jgi:AcrR family transcriptional regulator
VSVSSVRDRRRAETVAEIKEAALRQLVDAGPDGFSLRGVARAVGMTVQSLYHYFANRDALLTALVIDAHHSAADAVQASADSTRGRHPHERRLAACQAFREWALANRRAFLLLYGTPVPGFTPLPESDVGQAAWRLGQPFAEVVFDGWTPRSSPPCRPPRGSPTSTSGRWPRGKQHCRSAPWPCSSSYARGCTAW